VGKLTSDQPLAAWNPYSARVQQPHERQTAASADPGGRPTTCRAERETGWLSVFTCSATRFWNEEPARLGQIGLVGGSLPSWPAVLRRIVSARRVRARIGWGARR
jgi:hypothetical protein